MLTGYPPYNDPHNFRHTGTSVLVGARPESLGGQALRQKWDFLNRTVKVVNEITRKISGENHLDVDLETERCLILRFLGSIDLMIMMQGQGWIYLSLSCTPKSQVIRSFVSILRVR